MRGPSYKHFILNRVAVQIRQRYAHAVAGPLWAFAQPLLLLGIFWLIFSRVMPTRLGTGGMTIGYGYYLATGFFVWQCVNEIISGGTTVLRGNADLLRRLPIQLRHFFLENVLLALVGLAISFPLVLVLVALFGPAPTELWLLLPVPLLMAILSAYALAIICGLLNVLFRDIELILPAGLQFLLWTAPVVYSPDAIGAEHRWLLNFNPFTAPMILLRDHILYGQPGPPELWLLGTGWCLGLLLLAAFFYRRLAPEIRDNL
jgi:lipopolysaccharide transport system permease protein